MFLTSTCSEMRVGLASLPDGEVKSNAIAALDLIEANLRLISKETELDDASTHAGVTRVDFDALPTVVKEAYVLVVRAKASAEADAQNQESRQKAEAERAEEEVEAEAERRRFQEETRLAQVAALQEQRERDVRAEVERSE